MRVFEPRDFNAVHQSVLMPQQDQRDVLPAADHGLEGQRAFDVFRKKPDTTMDLDLKALGAIRVEGGQRCVELFFEDRCEAAGALLDLAENDKLLRCWRPIMHLPRVVVAHRL